MRNFIKNLLIKLELFDTYFFWLYRNRKYLKNVIKKMHGVHKRKCCCCGFSGLFQAYGFPPRFDALCPKCSSLERHRLFILIDSEYQLLYGSDVLLHFAPEICLEDYLKNKVGKYMTADINGINVDYTENIEDISFEDMSIDVVMCSHVLEHVNDTKALYSIYRVLKPGGRLIAIVPVCEGLSKTYEDSNITKSMERDLHFGQNDHLRYYGYDFIDRLKQSGFTVDSYSVSPEQCIEYGLVIGEKVFVARK